MKEMIRSASIFTLLLLVPFFAIKASHLDGIDFPGVYKALAGKSLQDIEVLLGALEKDKSSTGTAYEGALMMKKAGLLSKPMEKLKTFKSGRQKLDSAINAEPDNAEYRFLRLIIQENAPKILNYHGNIEADSHIILSEVNKLSAVVQQAVKEYSHTSKVLNKLAP